MSVQRWVGDPDEPQEYVVDVVEPDAVPEGWLAVLSGETRRAGPVVVVHEDPRPWQPSRSSTP